MGETMLTQTIPITQARYGLPRLIKKINRSAESSTFTITRRGKPILALLQWDFYESLMETLEIMADPELMKELGKNIKEIKRQKLISMAQIKKDIGL